MSSGLTATLWALSRPRARPQPSGASSSPGSGGSWLTHPFAPVSWLKLDDESCASADAGTAINPATIIVTASRTGATLSPGAGNASRQDVKIVVF